MCACYCAWDSWLFTFSLLSVSGAERTPHRQESLDTSISTSVRGAMWAPPPPSLTFCILPGASLLPKAKGPWWPGKLRRSESTGFNGRAGHFSTLFCMCGFPFSTWKDSKDKSPPSSLILGLHSEPHRQPHAPPRPSCWEFGVGRLLLCFGAG